MSKRAIHGSLAILGFVGFGVLMALRTEPERFGVRVFMAALAGICLGGALIYLGKARSSSPPGSEGGR